MITKQHSFISGIIVSVLLGVLVDVSGGMMNIQLIPQNPVIGGSVTLSVTGITGRIRYFIWYKGLNTYNDHIILTYIPGDNPTLSPGPLYNSRMTPLLNGSLQISNLNRMDEGNYTVKIQADQQRNTMVYLKIYATALCQTSGSGLGGGEIAGIVIGTVFGIFILEVIVYFVLKAKRKTPSSTVYENAQVPEQHIYEKTIPGTQGKVSQESNYEELTHKDKSIYSTMESASEKY